MAAAVLLPVKAFSSAKARLAPALDAAARAALACTMANRVVAAAHGMPVFVACDDDAVARWARDHGATVVPTHGLDLNGSVTRGIATVLATGATSVVIAHADLPFARDLTWTLNFRGATLVPDRRDDGTNVLALPAHVAASFEPSYGPGSFARHRAQLRAARVAVRIARAEDLQWDVDVPGDLPESAIA
ncbi:MAG TPA: 2-phospho-L-lactate guanylyltransferase [Acidimicrobiales bacterium]